MTPKVFVHVGPHKTGTTFLQAVLQRNKAALAEDGVLWPGTRYGAQRQAIQEMMRSPRVVEGRAEPTRWDRLAAEVVDWPGDAAILSQEGLAAAPLPRIQRLVESLAPAEVHVVHGVRDLTKVIPGGWHTRMRNGHHETWQEYLAAVRGEADWDPRFWVGQDPRGVFSRWERFVPRERIHVVTVPPSGAPQDLLWQRFCSVVGLEASRYSLELPRRLNVSLGTVETEVLRRINARVAGSMDRGAYERFVQVPVTRRVLVPRPDQTRYALREPDWVRARAEEIIAFLRDGGYEITGDLDDLLPAPASGSETAPDDVDLDKALDAATDVIAALLHQLDRREAERREKMRERRAPPVAEPVPAAERWLHRAKRMAALVVGRRSGLLARWRRRRRNRR
jgi:hypothetical protein